jgi:hypothetical protein
MACNIRNNKSIKGFNLPNEKIPMKWSLSNAEIKISQVADDTTVFTSDEQSTFQVIETIRCFSSISGLTLNMSKTEGIWLNRNQIPANLIKINWSIGPIKSLGIYFGLDKVAIQKLNWESKLDKLRRLLSVWRKRELTLYGKVVILKAIALSQLLYNMSVIETPNEILKEIETEMYSFIWKGKRDKIKRVCLINDHSEGGLKIPDIRLKLDALKATWVKRLSSSNFARWKLIPLYYLEKFGNNMLIFKMSYDKETLFPFLNNSHISEFYKHIVKSWHTSHVVCNPPETLMEIKNEYIWGNRYILSKNSTLYMKHWIDSDILCIGDICNTNGFIRADLLKAKFKNPNANSIHEYKTILDSIPKAWRDHIKKSEDLHWEKGNYFLKWNGQMYTLQELNKVNCKLVYSFNVKQKATKAYTEIVWNRLFQKEIDWNTIWIDQTIKLTNHMKIAEFNFKILHCILPSGKLLHR